MITPLLRTLLEQVAERERLRFHYRGLLILAGLGSVAALVLYFLARSGWSSWPLLLLLIVAGLGGFIFLKLRSLRHAADLREIARMVERADPHLQTALLAALDQKPQPAGHFTYVQQRVINEALASSRGGRWLEVVPSKRLALLRFGAWASVVVFVFLLLSSFSVEVGRTVRAIRMAAALEVLPGNAEIERGSPLTVIAKFHDSLPAEVKVELTGPGLHAEVPLNRSLDDPTFTNSIPSVEHDLTYRIKFPGGESSTYTVKVFDKPSVERVDATLKYPDYTKFPEKTLEDTRAISAIEQTDLSLQIRVNKPMESAQLVPAEGEPLALTPSKTDPLLYTAQFKMTESRQYEIALRDPQGRASERERLDIKVYPNKPPTVTVSLPVQGDPSTPLQEVTLEARVSDDFGLSATGLRYQVAGGEEKTIDHLDLKPGTVKESLRELIRLEGEKVQPNDLIVWNAWGEDIGPDGQPRRVEGDVNITSIRAFDQVMRQVVAPPPGEGEDGSDELIKVQTQILTGTWNVKRDSSKKNPPKAELETIHKSQSIAIAMAAALEPRLRDATARQNLRLAAAEMKAAEAHLARAADSATTAALPDALKKEQKALEYLYRLVSQNKDIALTDKPSSSTGDSLPPLEDIELKRLLSRYETENAGSPQESEKDREIRDILNRLKELAERQRDLNEQINRLQIAMAQAKSDEEKAALERELKRLREEQKELAADIDRLRQTAEDPDKQTADAALKEGIQKAQAQAQRSQQDLARKQLGDALASGKRLEDELKQTRDEYRAANADKLADQMRDLRMQARQLNERQEQIGSLIAEKEKPLSSASLSGDAEESSAGGLADRQTKELEDLLRKMDETARNVESTEPLVARKLEEALRTAARGKIENAVKNVQSRVASNDRPAAGEASREAAAKLNDLQERVEAAAESVLGSEVQSLKYARNEIAKLRRQLEGQAPGQSSQPNGEMPGDQPSDRPGQQAGNKPGQQPGDQPGNKPGDQPGKGEGEKEGEGTGGKPSESSSQMAQNGQPSNSPGQGQTGGGGQSDSQPGEGPPSENAAASSASNQPGPSGNGGGPGEGTGGNGGGYGQGGGNEIQNTRNVGTQDARGAGRLESPITSSEEFEAWTDRVRDIESTVDLPTARADLAQAREAARAMRIDYRRHSETPKWDLVSRDLLEPLLRAEEQINETLNRISRDDSLAPIERDPVPGKFTDVVRQYFEEIGK